MGVGDSGNEDAGFSDVTTEPTGVGASVVGFGVVGRAVGCAVGFVEGCMVGELEGSRVGVGVAGFEAKHAPLDKEERGKGTSEGQRKGGKRQTGGNHAHTQDQIRWE